MEAALGSGRAEGGQLWGVTSLSGPQLYPSVKEESLGLLVPTTGCFSSHTVEREERSELTPCPPQFWPFAYSVLGGGRGKKERESKLGVPIHCRSFRVTNPNGSVGKRWVQGSMGFVSFPGPLQCDRSIVNEGETEAQG